MELVSAPLQTTLFTTTPSAITNTLGLTVASDRNNILENTIEHNQAYGIQLLGVNNILKGNKLNNNTLNFDLDPHARIAWDNSKFVNDVDSSNTIEGKPIIFWVNEQDKKVTEDAAFVVLVNCTNIIVENLNLSKNMQGIILVSTVNAKVTNNSVEVSGYGIFVYNSFGNTIADNFVFNGGTGIQLISAFKNELISNSITEASIGITLEFSNENIIDGNIISGGFGGIKLDGSNNNTLRKNVIKDCKQLALMFWRNASQNLFYINSFINNIKNVEEYRPGFPEFPINIWDNGTVGNFWSDYYGTDTDGDGIGDTPYIIDENNQDNYPLTEPYVIPEFPSWIILPLLITLTFAATFYKKRLTKTQATNRNRSY